MIDQESAKTIRELQKKKKRHEKYLVGATAASVIASLLIPFIKGLVLIPWLIALVLVISEAIGYFKIKKKLFDILFPMRTDENYKEYLQKNGLTEKKVRADIPVCCFAVMLFFVVILVIPCVYFMISENYVAAIIFGALFIIAEMLFALKVSEERNKDTAIHFVEIYIHNTLTVENPVAQTVKAEKTAEEPTNANAMIKQPLTEEIGKNKKRDNKIAKIVLICVAVFYGCGFLAVIIGAVTGVLTDSDHASTTAGTGETQKPLSFADYYFYDIGTLLDEYQSNPVAADAKYLGKTVQVTGKVYMIDNTLKYTPFVVVTSEETYNFGFAYFYFTAFDEKELMKIKTGDEITIRGVIKENLAGTPAFFSSEIIFVNGEIVYGK